MVESLFTVGRVMGIHGEREVRSWRVMKIWTISGQDLWNYFAAVFSLSLKKKSVFVTAGTVAAKTLPW